MSRRELFEAYRRIGFQAVEVWKRPDDFDDIVGTASEVGLVVASMAGHDSLTSGLNNAANHDRIAAEIAESAEIAARYGIPGLICFSGNRLGEIDGMDQTVAGLKRVAPIAERHGVNLNLELLNSKVDHPGYECDRSSWGFEVCRRVASPRVKVLYDIYHMQIMEGNIIRTIRDNIDLIGHFHTAGNPDRRDLDDSQELNYAGICSAIAESGYDLFVGHEFSPKKPILESLEDAFRVCNR